MLTVTPWPLGYTSLWANSLYTTRTRGPTAFSNLSCLARFPQARAARATVSQSAGLCPASLANIER